MKILRILALIVSFNVSLAHAGGDADPVTGMVLGLAKRAAFLTAILCVADGLVEAVDDISLLPSFSISKDSTVNGLCKAGLGAIVFVATQPSQ